MKDTTDLSVLKRFVFEFPNSTHAREANDRIATLEAQTARIQNPPTGAKQPPAMAPPPSSAKEEAAWQTTRNSSVLFVYEDFLKAYPASRHADEARERIKQLQADLAPPNPRFDVPDRIGNAAPGATRPPDGKQLPAKGGAAVSTVSPPSQKEEAAWQVVRNSSVLFVYEEFLKAYPTSRHADEARERIKQLQAELVPANPRFDAPDRTGSKKSAPQR
jgi:hypothetical protein